MITWLNHHAALRFEGSKIIYTDPWKISSTEPKADIILITHSHYDHLSPPDVAKISKATTTVVAPADCAAKLPGANVKSLKPGESITIEEIKIEAVPAYNTNKQFHPKAKNWVGYIFTLDGERIYQAGDTDLIPEMKEIKADTVLLPIDGTYNMNAKEAAEAANLISPKLAIPIHWGKDFGPAEGPQTFEKLCRCKVQMLK